MQLKVEAMAAPHPGRPVASLTIESRLGRKKQIQLRGFSMRYIVTMCVRSEPPFVA